VLLIVTFRPEFEPPWIGRPYVTALTINRLGEREILAMIERVIGNKSLPANIRQDIIERTDGIPLFVEEMTKAVLEAESEGEARRTAAAIPAPVLAVPASLQASLMARLDRLGPAKEIAQIGAAIGREFSHSLLTAAARKPETELALALDRLIQSGLLFRQGEPPHANYLFKHALVQDAAYGTLLREGDARCMLGLLKQSRANSSRLPKTNRSCWRVTAPRPDSSRRPLAFGARQDNGRWSARHLLKRRLSSRVPSIRPRRCPPHRRYAAKRSSCR
jgi:hypothetical protein